MSSARPARRTSNHPPPLAGLSGTPAIGVRQTVSARTVVNTVATHANSTEKSASAPNSELRDELVRAVMPELRLLMQHLVTTTVERSIAPLLDKQRELEAAFKELQNAQLRSAQSANNPIKHAPEPIPVNRAVPVEVSPFVTHSVQTVSAAVVASVPTVAVARPTVSARNEVVPTFVYDTNSLADIPSELNGSRRKKAVAFAFAVVVAVLLLSVIGLSVLSNMRSQI